MYYKTIAMIRAIIVDDEKNAVSNLQWEISEFCDNVEIIGAYTNPKEAIKNIDELKPNCLLLDIQMPEIDGFQLLHQLKHKNFELIFTTAYENYAIQAFKENAIDYLLKPIDSDELILAFQKVEKRIHLEDDISIKVEKLLSSLIKDRKITLSENNRMIVLREDDILYCKSDGNYTYVYLEDGSKHLITQQIKHFDSSLNYRNFLRVHNSYIVNLNKIKEYYKGDGGEIILNNDVRIPVSRGNKAKLMEKLNF